MGLFALQMYLPASAGVVLDTAIVLLSTLSPDGISVMLYLVASEVMIVGLPPSCTTHQVMLGLGRAVATHVNTASLPSTTVRLSGLSVISGSTVRRKVFSNVRVWFYSFVCRHSYFEQIDQTLAQYAYFQPHCWQHSSRYQSPGP